MSHSSFKQLASDPMELPESNDDWFLYAKPSMVFSPGFRILQYYNWLAAGVTPRMALIWGHAYRSFDEFAINEPEEAHLSRTIPEVAAKWAYSRHFQGAFSNLWLLTTVIGQKIPIQEREQWADIYFEQVDEKRDTWLTIPFARLLRGDLRALFQPTVQKALWWAWSMFSP